MPASWNAGTSAAAHQIVNVNFEEDKTVCTLLENDWTNQHSYFVFIVMSTGELLEGPVHSQASIGLDIADFPPLMYGFIMQRVHIQTEAVTGSLVASLSFSLTCRDFSSPMLMRSRG